MFAVEVNRENYEYDIYALVKAFWPEETVRVVTPQMSEEKRAEAGGSVRMRIEVRETEIILQVAENAGTGSHCKGTAIPGCGECAEGVLSPGREDCGETQDSGESCGETQDGGESRESCGETQDGGESRESCGETQSGGETAAWVRYEYQARDGGRDQLAMKQGFKRFFYQVLCRETGQELPWGNLTGIRPTKLAYGLLEEGRTEKEILDFLSREHFVSGEKSRLSIDIARREMELLEDIHYEKGYSLYIGIPFCPTTCLYCSFPSFAIGAYRNLVDQYIDCVIREMEFVAQRYKDKILDTVYIGGGTPTTLEAEQLDRLTGRLQELFDFTYVKEFTVEAGRPDSITPEKLKALRRRGVGRISINPQTMKQETLDLIGRRHTVEQVISAYRMAREAGFDNINMDLILGLPGESAQDVRKTVDQIVTLAPDSLTVHSLAVKRASRLSQWIQENGVRTLRNTEETMAIAAAGASRLGMEPYYLYRQKNMSGNFENVGYAAPGKAGLYNVLIMEEKQTIVALGAGSITKVVYPDGRIERCENVKDIRLYLENTGEMIERKRALL